MNDTYSSFQDLARQNTPGRDYRITLLDRRAATTVVAPHAGGIEPGASEIARAIAGEDLNCYLFEGLRESSNADLHLTSTRFDEPRGLELISRSMRVITVHGCQGDTSEVKLGGLDISLRDQLVEQLYQAGFTAVQGLGDLSGSLATNLCNLGHSGRGVQLEISTGLRRLLFRNLDSRPGRETVTPLFDNFVAIIRHEISEI